MGELQNKIQMLWLAERPRWILWLPVFLGMGVGIYFGLENEPRLAKVFAGCVAAGIAAFAMWRRERPILAACSFLLFWIMLGVSAAGWRTSQVAAPIIDRELYPQQVTGTVAEITTRPDSTRFTLEDAEIADITAARMPKYITVSLRNHADPGIGLGDRITMRAGFFPPPKPGIAGGFAFNRHFFFKRIGAMGYSIGYEQPQIIYEAEKADGFKGWIARTRHRLAQWLMEEMGPREGAVAAALMVGESRAIPEDVYEAMRQSGLVHVLSISGMHLTLAAGIFFFTARLVLACIPAFSLRHDGKKLAAAIALFGSFAYLLLAGMPISAQRSFVMVALVLLAVMLSRNVTPIRSLCLAGFLLLLATPEALLNPGFQLSFAATMAILACYENWRRHNDNVPAEERGWRHKQWQFWSGIVVTSVVATLATMPYILHHFDGLPLYSVFANLLVMPLASFWIMPWVVVILITLPLGLAGIFLPLLTWGIMAMLAIAERIYALPYAVLDLPPLTTGWLVCITLGGLWLCLWQQRWRYLGIIPILAGCASLALYEAPDMVISGDGRKIAVRVGEDEIAMLRGQRSGFTQDSWKRFLRVPEFLLRRQAPENTLRCDALGCIYQWQGQEVAISYHRATLREDCAESGIVVTPEWSSYYDSRDWCRGVHYFDRYRLEKSHGVSIWLGPDGIRYRTVRGTLGNRPWSGK